MTPLSLSYGCCSVEMFKGRKILAFCQEIKEEQHRRAEELRQSTNHGAIGQRSHLNGGQNPADNDNQGVFGSALANIFVIVGLAAFAYTVKYVLKSIVE